MKKSSIEERVVDLVANQLGVKKEEVTLKASFLGDLGADSLDTVELVMALEEEFGLDIPDEEAEKITTVGAAVEYIKKAKGVSASEPCTPNIEDSSPECALRRQISGGGL